MTDWKEKFKEMEENLKDFKEEKLKEKIDIEIEEEIEERKEMLELIEENLNEDSPQNVVDWFLWKTFDFGSLDEEKIIEKIKDITEYGKRKIKQRRKELVEEAYGEKEEFEREEKSKFQKDGKLYEEIKTEDGVRFATLNDGEPKYFEKVENIFPIYDKAVEEGGVILPTEIGEYESMDTLLEEIQKFIHKYLDVSDMYEKLASWYVLLTWVYDKLHTIPYLRALGDTGTGKTRLLDAIGSICYKPMNVGGSVRPAPIYRMVQKWKGTLILDEADFSGKKQSDIYNEVIKILNCGFEEGKPVIRCHKDRPDDLQFFDVFCPKLIATRQSYKDKALESRCITEVMEETDRDIPENLGKEFQNKAEKLRNKLLRFRLEYRNEVEPEDAPNIDVGNIEPRLKQAMRPLAVLFSQKEEMMDKFRGFLNKFQKELIEERSNTYEGMIANVIYKLIEEAGEKHISSRDIADWMEENYGMDDVSSISIGKRIKSFGLDIEKERVENGTKRCIQLDEKTLKKVFRRYVPDVQEGFSESEKENQGNAESVPDVPSVPGEEGKHNLNRNFKNKKSQGSEGTEKTNDKKDLEKKDSDNMTGTSGTSGTSSDTSRLEKKTPKKDSGTSGTDKSSSPTGDKIKSTILDIVNELDNSENEETNYENVIDRAGEECDIRIHELEKIIGDMIENGDLFEPKPGKLKTL